MFLTNCWYAAAWSEELGTQIQERIICEEKLVLFRKLDGTVEQRSHPRAAPAG